MLLMFGMSVCLCGLSVEATRMDPKFSFQLRLEWEEHSHLFREVILHRHAKTISKLAPHIENLTKA